MDVLMSWLLERSGVKISAREAATLLTRQGVEVGQVRAVADGLTGVLVAQVEAVEALTDRLSSVTVSAGGRRGRVVTGAPVAPGDIRPWAPPGAALPDGRTLGTQIFHGVASEGMLLSAREAGLGPEEDRLLDLGGLPSGADVRGALGLPDAILEIELTPNLAAFAESVDGLGRELRAALGLPFPGTADVLGTEIQGEGIEARLAHDGLVRQYLGALITDPPAATPLWMRRRLWGAGQRSLGAVVDVTNYLLLESGQPLHAFDLDRLTLPIEVRRAHAGEHLVTLDHVERRLDTEDIVIADRNGPIGLAGVMGGEETEVTMGTRRVYLEAAVFDPVSIRRTARRHGLPSLAAARFERGVDEEATSRVLHEAIRLLLIMGAGEGRVVTAEMPSPPERRCITVRTERTRSLLGMDVDDAAMADDLERLGFGVALGDGTMTLDIPPRRRDVQGEADVAEEIGRIEGYDTLAETPLPPEAPGRRLEADRSADDIRSILSGLGLSEHWGTSFTSREAAAAMGLEAIKVENPLVRDAGMLRPSLIPSLLAALALNISRRQLDVRLFEIGTVYEPEKGRAREDTRLGILLAGAWPKNWATPGGDVSFFDLAGVVEVLSRRLHIEAEVRRLERDVPFLHPGRQARLVCGEAELGLLGEIHPAMAPEGALGTVLVAELSLTALMASRRTPSYRPVSRYPAVARDLAVVFPEAIGYDEVAHRLRAKGPDVLRSVELFDVYRGRPVPEGQKSLAVHLVFQADDRTLSDAEVDGLMEAIRGTLGELGGRIRA